MNKKIFSGNKSWSFCHFEAGGKTTAFLEGEKIYCTQKVAPTSDCGWLAGMRLAREATEINMR